MGRKYIPVENGNMVLTRSKDKKIISVTNFDKMATDRKYFKVLAWSIKLNPFQTTDEFENLNRGMSDYYHMNK